MVNMTYTILYLFFKQVAKLFSGGCLQRYKISHVMNCFLVHIKGFIFKFFHNVETYFVDLSMLMYFMYMFLNVIVRHLLCEVLKQIKGLERKLCELNYVHYPEL